MKQEMKEVKEKKKRYHEPRVEKMLKRTTEKKFLISYWLVNDIIHSYCCVYIQKNMFFFS